MEKKLNLSVHQLVDFLLRTGDIDNRIFNKSTMAEGTRIHSFYQNKQGRNYLSEYYLKETFEVDINKIVAYIIKNDTFSELLISSEFIILSSKIQVILNFSKQIKNIQ